MRSHVWLTIGLILLLAAGILSALAVAARPGPDVSTSTITTLGRTATVYEVTALPGVPLPGRVVTRRLTRTLTTPGRTVTSAGRTETQTQVRTVVQTVAGSVRTVTSFVTQTHDVTVAGPTVTVPGPTVQVTVTVKGGPPPCTPPPKC